MRRSTAAGNVNGLFTNGDPANQVPATAISADDFNVYQEELVNVVLCAGLSLDTAGTDLTQVAQGIRAMITAMTRDTLMRTISPPAFHIIGAGTGAANITPQYVAPSTADGNYDYAFHSMAGVLLPGMIVSKLYVNGAALAGNNTVNVILESVDMAGAAPVTEMSVTITNGQYTNNSTTSPVTIVDTKAYTLAISCKADVDVANAKFYAAKIELA